LKEDTGKRICNMYKLKLNAYKTQIFRIMSIVILYRKSNKIFSDSK